MGLCGVMIPHSRGPAAEVFSECPRGAGMALKDYSDNEAARSRGWDLVSALQVIFTYVLVLPRLLT